MNDLIHRLVALDESRNGKPNSPHELKALIEWIHQECLLRWPTAQKDAVSEMVVKIPGYQFLEVKDDKG